MMDATGELSGWLRSNADVLQFGLFAGLFLVLGAAERLVPRRRGDARRRARWPANLGLTLLALIALSILPALVPVSFIAAADWAQQRGWGLLNALALPALPALVATLLLRGFISWLTHLLMHKTPALWRVHRVHHLDTVLDVTTTVRFHPAEFLINLPIGVVLVVAFGLSPVPLLVYELLDVAVTLFSHANLRLPERVDRVLRRVIVTPDLHRIHHSSWQPETDSNFSAVFPVWDMLLGTYRGSARDGHDAMELGLTEARAPRADRLLWLLASPLRRDLSERR
jgi:sterol desaturase/sphingolipid hydroxylase (fatty acid hydroxylase superfamily)